jgi:hypothetical protein
VDASPESPQHLQVELTPVDVHDGGEIERALTAFASEPNAGSLSRQVSW